MDIEQLAVAEIKTVISRTDYIKAFINDGDKEPSWDGNLYVYSDISQKNKYYKGKVPVQIKGKKCKKFSNKELKYLIRVVDLRNYSIEGGTIYFVVEIAENGTTKVFYISLLPFELNNLLKTIGKKNKLTVTLKEFPTDKNEVTNIILNFLRDKDSQVLLRNGADISLKDLIKQFGIDKITYSFTYTGLGYNRNQPYKYLFNHDIYIYAEFKEMNIKVPIEHIQRIDMCKSEMEGEISIDGEVYYHKYNIVHHKNLDMVLQIGESIVFILKDNGMSKIQYTPSDILDERIIAEKMMIQLIKCEEVFISGIELKLNLLEEEKEKFNIAKMESHVKYLEELKETLKSLGVQETLNCSKLTKKDEDYIKMLLLSQKYRQGVGFNKKVIPPIASVNIGNLKIMLYFKPNEDGTYMLENYTHCKIEVMGECKDHTKFLTSKFTILTKDDFLKVSNLNEKFIVDELISINNTGHISRTILTLLEMIKAYDVSKKIFLLEQAERLASWILSVEESPIAVINLYQCYIRKRELTEIEEEKLDEILDCIDDNVDKQIKIAVCILQRNIKRANSLIIKLSKEERKVFEEYPIYSLLEEFK